ncbi:MAG: DUF2007 domain-containing protein, partial [Paramuribaculum sp.]|nr:DUF2007 domain-containing protein [Paramuribaculum sp.]
MKRTTDPDRLTSIGDFENIADAYIAMGALKNEGIPCQVVDGLSSLYTPLPMPAGGTKLHVFQPEV